MSKSNTDIIDLEKELDKLIAELTTSVSAKKAKRHTESAKKYYKENKEKCKQLVKKFKEKNPEYGKKYYEKNLQKITDSIAKTSLKQTLSNLDKSIEGINKSIQDLNSDSSSLGLLIRNDEFYKKLNSSVNDLNQLLIDLKNNPKRYIHFSIFGRKDKSSGND